ncbi:Sensor histidine kinase QseE [compost metagenome]
MDVIIAAHSLPARAKMMRTVCDFSPEPVLAEPMLLMSVLDNLYSNAVHYGSESGTIYLRSTQVGKTLHIDVGNTGDPIPPAEREMIFEPFYQGSHQRKGAVKGSGLGLSIAQDCIRRMHGELHLIDDETVDVCFRIELPVFPENK